MQIEDFVKVYQSKSDEELVQLAVAREQLTTEALLALQSELSRRAISIRRSPEVSPPDTNAHEVRALTPGKRLRMGDGHDEGVGNFVSEVLRTYHSHFWLFFKINAPAVLVTTIAVIAARDEVREISHHLPRGLGLVGHETEILEMSLLNFSAWILSWIAFCFVFGATCIAVEENAAGFTASAGRSFLNIRERLIPFLRVSLLLLIVVVAAEAASVVVALGVFWVFRHERVHTSTLVTNAVSYGLVYLGILVASRFFLAVPAVILDDSSVWQAIFRSDKLSEGKWSTLAALLAKCIVGGYVAGMSPFWLASFIHVSAPLPSWFSWVLTIASMICITAVEPTIFVGFALLYLKMSALDPAPSKALASQLT